VVCPQCQLSNPPGATSCHKCNTPIDLGDATVFEPVEDFVSRSAAGADEGNGQVATVWSKIADQPTADPHGHVSIVPGSVLAGRYEVLQQLGEGGMGAVYKVRDRELDRLVALKVIRPDLARHPEILQRFKRELILARQITHRNVVRIFDLGVSGPTKFITMEYLEGGALNSLMANGKLPPVQAVEILRQVCRGLEVAHGENVIHRDLKPQNIMVGRFGEVYVMDWGVPAVAGTPAFRAPEGAHDFRSDIYALGALLQFILPAGASPALRAIAAKAMQADPAARYPDAPALLADIDRFQDGLAVEAWKEPLGHGLRRFGSRNAVLLWLLAAYASVKFLFFFLKRL
jgi:eukaryotic-like serine/threonine-protein kinase